MVVVSFIGKELNTVAHQLQSSFWREKRVVVKTGQFSCESGWHWMQLIPAFFSCLLSRFYQRENRITIEYFQKIFGASRLRRISRRWGLYLDFKHTHGLALTGNDIEKIFVGAALVNKQDLKEIFRGLKSTPSGGYRHLGEKEAKVLRDRFVDKEFKHLTKGDVDLLWQVVVPFDKMETIFLNNVPQEKDISTGGGKSFYSVRNTVYLMHQMNRWCAPPERGVSYQQMWDANKMKWRMLRTLPINTILKEPNGYRRYLGERAIGGAHVCFLKKFAGEERFYSQVAFCGTQKDKWESIWDDFRKNPGSFGARMIYPYLNRIFKGQDPLEGGYFVEPNSDLRQQEKLEGIGYSLGGAHLARIVCAFLSTKIFQRATFINGVGVDKRTAKWFRKRVRRNSIQISLKYQHNGSDFVTRFGEEHLGKDCPPQDVDIDYLLLLSKEERKAFQKWRRSHPNENPLLFRKGTPPDGYGELFRRTMRHLSTSKGSHNHRTFSDPGRQVFYFSNQDDEGRRKIDEGLQNREWEAGRSRMGRWFASDGDDFVEFLDEEEEKRAAEWANAPLRVQELEGA